MNCVEQAGGIVLNPEGQVLLVRNQLNRTTLPKGSIKPGETPQLAARRELYEEGGLVTVSFVRAIGMLHRPGFTSENHIIPTVMKRINMFLCTTDQVQVEPVAEDIVEAWWEPQVTVSNALSWVEEAKFYAASKPFIDRV